MSDTITINEAIKLIQTDIDDESVEWDSPLGRAYKLGFEALKSVKAMRRIYQSSYAPLLPGETNA